MASESAASFPSSTSSSSASSSVEYEQLRKDAMQSLKTALDLDEKSQRNKALLEYENASKLLEQALSIDANDNPVMMNKQSQLMIYLIQVQDRIEELDVKVSVEPHTTKKQRNRRRDLRLNNNNENGKPADQDGKSSSSSTNNDNNSDSNQLSAIELEAKKTERHRKILSSIDEKFQELIMREVVDSSPHVAWSDIVGLREAKQSLQESVIYPMLRPDLYTGIRSPPKGILLFGPPGTGKSMLAAATASTCDAKFYNISAATLNQKFVGESEKVMRALFGLARITSPSVIFIDEIDSLLGQRSDGDHEASTRLKNEFFLQCDGVGHDPADRVLVLGATNRPDSLDDAALRRLSKHIYVPLPETPARQQLITNLLQGVTHSLSGSELQDVAGATAGYSGSDIYQLVSEAARLPLRELADRILDVQLDQVRPVSRADFAVAMSKIRASCKPDSVVALKQWAAQFGTHA